MAGAESFDDINYDDLDIDLDSALVDINPMLSVPNPRGAEYIFNDEFQGRKLTWGDRFTWLIGGAYLTGSAMGGSYGVVHGLRSSGVENRLALARALNGASKFGTSGGQKAAIMALMFSSLQTVGSVFRNREDKWTVIGAAAVTPAIYYSQSGILRMLGSSVVGAGVGGLLLVARSMDVLGIRRALPNAH
eukprot:TRINITY_DN4176_c0_g2_i1.p1 TRINITY_DN4176_c0_g2~~TRINITY_DN4176_c0_g2_i1.p1  ORF type:complete len:190 (+),score=19.43 TRINITY_DN4176_c0_g2_i1:62-631(+)